LLSRHWSAPVESVVNKKDVLIRPAKPGCHAFGGREERDLEPTTPQSLRDRVVELDLSFGKDGYDEVEVHAAISFVAVFYHEFNAIFARRVR
jgi:hypothetical protein